MEVGRRIRFLLGHFGLFSGVNLLLVFRRVFKVEAFWFDRLFVGEIVVSCFLLGGELRRYEFLEPMVSF